jgi:hypothetical protein
VTICDNAVNGLGDTNAGPDSWGIVCAWCVQLRVARNSVINMQGGGIAINGGDVLVHDNHAAACGLGANTGNGLKDGFFFTIDGTNVGVGIARNNVSRNNSRYGYQVEYAQNLSWIDNLGSGNGSADFNVVAGVELYGSPVWGVWRQPSLLAGRPGVGDCAVGSMWIDSDTAYNEDNSFAVRTGNRWQRMTDKT